MSFEEPVILRLGDFAQVKGGKRMPAGTALTSEKTSHPYLRIVDFKDGSIEPSGLQYVPESVFPKISRYVISSDDLYISIVGTIGLVGSVPSSLSGANLTENAAKICNIDSTKINRRYLSYYLRSGEGQSAINALTVGSTQPKLALFRIEQIEIPVPSLEVQQGVADVLSALDDRIAILRETNATLEAIAQALFKSWFVDFDPVRAKMAGRAPEGMDEATAALFPDALEETELGVVPKGWRVGALDSLAALNPESWSAKHHPDRLLYVDLANTKENQIEGITEFAFDEAPSRARRVLRDGDVIVGTVRPGNRSFARISVDRAGLTGSTGFAVLRAHHHSDQALVYIAATRDEAIERLAHLADGGAYPAVRPEVVAGTPVVIAPESVRQAFGEVANHLLASVGSNQEQSRYLADLRDTLLPRLISGRLRLPEAQAQLEHALA
jgi:type I restriction enzyme, S subunit